MTFDTDVALIDPLNDFLRPEGKLYSRLQASLKASGCLKHIHELVSAARQAHIPIFTVCIRSLETVHISGRSMGMRLRRGFDY